MKIIRTLEEIAKLRMFMDYCVFRFHGSEREGFSGGVYEMILGVTAFPEYIDIIPSSVYHILDVGALGLKEAKQRDLEKEWIARGRGRLAVSEWLVGKRRDFPYFKSEDLKCFQKDYKRLRWERELLRYMKLGRIRGQTKTNSAEELKRLLR